MLWYHKDELILDHELNCMNSSLNIYLKVLKKEIDKVMINEICKIVVSCE